MFHRHKWKTTGEKYTPRNHNMTHFEGHTNDDLYLKVMFGVTVITQECAGCGLLRTEGVPGQTEGAN